MTLPASIAPMLATAGTLPADDGAWGYEIKWDGVRSLAYLDGGAGTMRLESRNLIDITVRYPELEDLARAAGDREVVLDGEIVAFDASGRPSFSLLQQRMHIADRREAVARTRAAPVTYEIFDLLWLEGTALAGEPLSERRARLLGLGLAPGCWQIPGSHVGDGAALLEATRAQGLEGVVAKKLASTYEPGRRSRNWLKIKNFRSQEVVIGGWMEGEGNRAGRLGALLVGCYDGDRLLFAGRVGTGFSDRVLRELQAGLEARAAPASPFAQPVPYRKARFVRPELVAEVAFTEWTPGGTLRHPSFKGLRDDKDPHEVVRESS